VILWGERIGAQGAGALLQFARSLGARLLEIPCGANGRGLREAGCLPDAGPGYQDAPSAGRSATQIAEATVAGDIHALYLYETDPVRDHPDRALWEQALHHAGLVVAQASVLTDGLKEHADVVFPAESHAEKEGTLVHPDGRVQRLRAAIGHPGEIRSGWRVLAELAKSIGLDTGVLTSGMAFAQLVESVPFYRGLTLDELGGRGVRWPEREQAGALPGAAGETAPAPPSAAIPGEAPATSAAEPGPYAGAPASEPVITSGAAPNGALRLGRYRPIWADPEVEISPALHYTIARQQVELSPEDARRLGIASGDPVQISQNGTRLRGTAQVRSGVPSGIAFLAEGIAADSANALTGTTVEVHKS
jgi:NADH-quinone oxidoreductase subunit G